MLSHYGGSRIEDFTMRYALGTEGATKETDPANPLDIYRDYLNEHLVMLGINGYGESQHYIPYQALEEYWSAERVDALLRFRKGEVESNRISQQAGRLTSEISGRFRRIFSILVFMGEPSYIDKFILRNVDDSHLPLVGSWPYPEKDYKQFHDIFRIFCDQQWKFCPLSFTAEDIMYRRQLDSRHILPFKEKIRLGEGVDGNSGEVQLWKITLQNECIPWRTRTSPDVRCRSPSLLSRDKSEHNERSQVFVMKTYSNHNQKLFDREVEAHVALGRRQCGAITQCYGSFIQNGLSNIILEYADQGSLEDMFRANEPPKTVDEIHELWRGLADLLQGLHHIHRTFTSDDETGTLLGVHADIKPENILVLGPKSPYDRMSFKIGDFGVSHQDNICSHQLGSRTYSPPETSRPTKGDLGRPTELCDVWSLGCVFSESLTWTVSGETERESFYRRRIQERHLKGLDTARGVFHDDYTVLEEVVKTSNGLRDRLGTLNKTSASLIGVVLDLCMDYMLIREDKGRLRAKFIHRLWKKKTDQFGSWSRTSGKLQRDTVSIEDNGGFGIAALSELEMGYQDSTVTLSKDTESFRDDQQDSTPVFVDFGVMELSAFGDEDQYRDIGYNDVQDTSNHQLQNRQDTQMENVHSGRERHRLGKIGAGQHTSHH